MGTWKEKRKIGMDLGRGGNGGGKNLKLLVVIREVMSLHSQRVNRPFCGCDLIDLCRCAVVLQLCLVVTQVVQNNLFF